MSNHEILAGWEASQRLTLSLLEAIPASLLAATHDQPKTAVAAATAALSCSVGMTWL